MNRRLKSARLLIVPLVATAVVSHHVYPEGGMIDDVLGGFGLVLLLAAMGGRIWASAHLVGRKDRTLVTSGPYSITRNPLYLFSLLGFAGAGLAFESLVLGVAFAGIFFVTHWPTIEREENRLEALFGADFAEYRDRVPRFVPNLARFRAGPTIALDPRRFSRALRDCLAIPLVFVAAQLLESAKVSGVLPILLELP